MQLILVKTVRATAILAWVLYLSAGAVSGYFAGQKSWHAVPAAIFLTSIAVGNLWACLRTTRGVAGERRYE